jgi:hypothetical protein
MTDTDKINSKLDKLAERYTQPWDKTENCAATAVVDVPNLISALRIAVEYMSPCGKVMANPRSPEDVLCAIAEKLEDKPDSSGVVGDLNSRATGNVTAPEPDTHWSKLNSMEGKP